jgi:solute carrier family 35 protein C2
VYVSLRSSAIPIGVCTGVDVAFSNLSLMYITITFYTILKSGSLLWCVIISF